MKQYNMTIQEKTLANGLHMILVHKPGYYRSLCTLATDAGGFDLVQSYEGEQLHYRTGCAHYLEHQMFRYHGLDVTEEFAKNSASTNAFTSFNKTAYYFQTTSDIQASLELLLNFVEELDIDAESVEKERGIILSEYDMYDQQPEQRLFKETWRSLYKNHPLRIDVLGNREDIQEMSVEDLQKFYKYNYDPSRLTLIVVTGKDIDEIESWVTAHQAEVPSRIDGEVKRIIPLEDALVNRSHTELEMDISMPYVCVAYKFEAEKDIQLALKKDFAIQMALDALMSPLNPKYQSWLDQKIITQLAGAECDITTDHAYLLFYAQTPKVEAFIELVNELVKDLGQSLTQENYQALKARTIASNIRGLDAFENLAIELLEAKIIGYDYWQHLNLVNEVSKSEIEELLQTLDFTNQTITTILPKASKS